MLRLGNLKENILMSELMKTDKIAYQTIFKENLGKSKPEREGWNLKKMIKKEEKILILLLLKAEEVDLF